MSARKTTDHRHNLKAIPAQPAYDDELSAQQVDAIRKLADPDGKRAAKRVVLYPALA